MTRTLPAKAFTRHALERMQERGMTRQQATEVLTKKEVVTDGSEWGRKMVMTMVEGKVLVVVVGTRPGRPMQVVSAYPAEAPKTALYHRLKAA